MFKLPDSDQIEVFGPTTTSHAQLIGQIQRDGPDAWQHFRGPDGNIYEVNGKVV